MSSTANGLSYVDYSSGVGVDTTYTPGGNQILPDLSQVDLAGQFLSFPGGMSTGNGVGASDSSGVNSIYIDPTVNPTPTGGYLDALAKIAAIGMNAFTTYSKGSPSVAIPGARQPASNRTVGGALGLTTATGGTNWLAIGIVVVAGLAGIVWLVKKA